MTRTILALLLAAGTPTVYTLAFSACQDAQHCERHEILVDSCLGYGVPFLAAWAAEHPGWEVVHWTCAEGQPS